MKTEKLKREIEERTGIPAEDFKGKTPGDIIAQAEDRALNTRRGSGADPEELELEAWAKWFWDPVGNETPERVMRLVFADIRARSGLDED